MVEVDMVNVKPDVRKLLLIGNSGSGKTNFIGTMPKPCYIFSFDKGYTTLAGMPGIKVGLCMDEDRYKPHAYMDFKTKFDALRKGEKYKWPDGREEPYKTIAFDSLTFLSSLLYDHEQRVNNTIDKQGGFGVWGNVKSKLNDIISQSVLIAEYVVATTLVKPEKDDITGELFFLPEIAGSIRDSVDAWFDAVFYMAIDKDAEGKKKYKMLTVGDRRYRAKIRLPSSIGNVVSAVEEPSFVSLMAKIDKALEQAQTVNQPK